MGCANSTETGDHHKLQQRPRVRWGPAPRGAGSACSDPHAAYGDDNDELRMASPEASYLPPFAGRLYETDAECDRMSEGYEEREPTALALRIALRSRVVVARKSHGINEDPEQFHEEVAESVPQFHPNAFDDVRAWQHEVRNAYAPFEEVEPVPDWRELRRLSKLGSDTGSVLSGSSGPDDRRTVTSRSSAYSTGTIAWSSFDESWSRHRLSVSDASTPMSRHASYSLPHSPAAEHGLWDNPRPSPHRQRVVPLSRIPSGAELNTQLPVPAGDPPLVTLAVTSARSAVLPPSQ